VSAIDYFQGVVFPATFSMLPKKMDSKEARAMLLAIGLQESRFEERRQLGNGPAVSPWQFEPTGVSGVLSHKASRPVIVEVVNMMDYPLGTDLHRIIENNDILACCFARCLLWTHPNSLPIINQPTKGWMQYINCWRPGKPHQQTWEGFFNQAWEML